MHTFLFICSLIFCKLFLTIFVNNCQKVFLPRECITVIGALILGEITPFIWVLGEYLDKTHPSITVTVGRVKLSLPLFCIAYFVLLQDTG